MWHLVNIHVSCPNPQAPFKVPGSRRLLLPGQTIGLITKVDFTRIELVVCTLVNGVSQIIGDFCIAPIYSSVGTNFNFADQTVKFLCLKTNELVGLQIFLIVWTVYTTSNPVILIIFHLIFFFFCQNLYTKANFRIYISKKEILQTKK